MAEDSDLERTEAATGKRVSQAREDGRVPRSRELSTFSIVFGGIVVLIMFGRSLQHHIQLVFERIFRFDQQRLADPSHLAEQLRLALMDAALAVAPFLIALYLIALFNPLLVGGWNLTFKPLELNLSKMNPLSGLKRLLSLNSAMEAGKAILKSMLIGGIASWDIWHDRADVLSLLRLPLERAQMEVIRLLEHTLLVVSMAMAVLVLFDVPFQIWQYRKSMRMTKDEVKREAKEDTGNPEVKGRIRQMQRDAARRRMMRAIPNANVVITNPMHYAVALRYEDSMRAPQVVAKGRLLLAEQIINIAREHHVTIMRSPPFARALYHNTELGQEIPSALYTAAAQILAYVFQLKHYSQYGGIAPIYPNAVPVPPELDPYTKEQTDTAE